MIETVLLVGLGVLIAGYLVYKYRNWSLKTDDKAAATVNSWISASNTAPANTVIVANTVTANTSK